VISTPSVTEVLRIYQETQLRKVSPTVLLEAQERGQDFHRLAALYAQSLWIEDVPESCAGYFQSFTRWFDAMVVEVDVVEQRLVHKVFHYTGTPDFIGRLKGDIANRTLIDWKTPQTFSQTWRLQLAAYEQLAKSSLAVGCLRVASLQPHPKGKRAKFREYTASLLSDFKVFLAALTVWRFLNA